MGHHLPHRLHIRQVHHVATKHQAMAAFVVAFVEARMVGRALVGDLGHDAGGVD